MSDLHFNEESDYSEKSTSDNEDFCSTIPRLFQFETEQKKTYGNESHEEETKHIHALAADLLHIRIENPNWCKCRHYKNKAKEIYCLCCGDVHATLTALDRILEHKGRILSSSFYGELSDY